MQNEDKNHSYDNGGLLKPQVIRGKGVHAVISGKYEVSKKNGDPIEDGALYFVLRIDTDPYARFAVSHYAHRLIYDDVNKELGEGLLQWLDQTADTPGGIKQKEISDRIEEHYRQMLDCR